VKPRRVLEDVLIPLTIVAAPPMTITQRNCFEMCGLTKEDYLRLVAAGAFPVKEEGKLRVASYADVERYLTSGATERTEKPRRAHRRTDRTPTTAPPSPKKTAPKTEAEIKSALDGFDFGAARRKGGFRTP
jgi:hypothetical protein